MKRTLSIFLTAVMSVIALDQGSKWLAQFLGLQITYNTGVAFGAFAALDQGVLLISILVIGGVTWWVLKQSDQLTLLLGGIFVGAGLSNVLDRLWYEGVRDWMYVPILNVHNNLADWLLSLVVVVVILQEIRQVLSQRKVKK